MLIKDARAKTVQDALQLQETDTMRLQQQLADASREVGAARGRVADAERRAYDAKELASRQVADARGQGAAQKANLLQRMSKAEALRHVRDSTLLCDHNTAVWCHTTAMAVHTLLDDCSNMCAGECRSLRSMHEMRMTSFEQQTSRLPACELSSSRLSTRYNVQPPRRPQS